MTEDNSSTRMSIMLRERLMAWLDASIDWLVLLCIVVLSIKSLSLWINLSGA